MPLHAGLHLARHSLSLPRYTKPFLALRNTRRRTISNSLSAVASSSPVPASPRRSDPYPTVPSQSAPLHSQPNPCEPKHSKEHSLECSIDCYQFLAQPDLAQPSMPEPAPPHRTNTRRMTVANHLSTVSSSLPILTSPDLATPCPTEPDRIAPNQTTVNQSACL